MRATIRTVLTWLVALAIPVQAFAAATMLSCGPGHERMAGAMHVDHDDAAPGGAHGHIAVAPGGAHVAIAAPGDADVVTAASGDANHPAALGAFKCSACAACCMASALPATPLVVAAVRTGSDAIPERHQPTADLVVERLEHPPRDLPA